MSDFGKLVPYVKRKWVKALRSGEYEQASEVLCERVDGFTSHCCLGVLVEEMAPAALIWDTEDAAYDIAHIGDDYESSFIPDDLACLWGLTEDAQSQLGNLNDSGKPFPVIADWIEANL